MSNRSDNFDRADDATSLGTPSDGGAAWVALVGTWGIGTNAAYNPSKTAHATAYLESSEADGAAQATIAIRDSAGREGLIARAADANNYLLVYRREGPDRYELFKRVAGSFTSLGTFASSGADGDVVKLSFSGSALEVFINAVSQISASDSAGSTNTKHGMYFSTQSATDTARIDDFTFTGSGGGRTLQRKRMAGVQFVAGSLNGPGVTVW